MQEQLLVQPKLHTKPELNKQSSTPTTQQPLTTPNQIANNTQTTTTTNNINLLQLKIDGINTKIHELANLINKRNIHIAMIQESKLK